jgi:hypothetical protein
MENNIDQMYEKITADILPFESWEKLSNESAAAYAAFCVFRDLGAERNIRKAVDAGVSEVEKRPKRYRMWRNWASQYKWNKRAGDYDNYLDKLNQAEKRKTIEAREAAYREVTGKMLNVVNKKLDLMNAGELKQAFVAEWMRAAIDTEREVLNVDGAAEKKENDGQMCLNFSADFNGV